MVSWCGCAPAPAAPCSRRDAAKGARNSRCELRLGRPGDLLPGRPPSQTKGFRRVLRLRDPRVRTSSSAVLPARRSRREAGSLPCASGRHGRRAQSSAAALARDLPPNAGSLRGPRRPSGGQRPAVCGGGFLRRAFDRLSLGGWAGAHAGHGAAMTALDRAARLVVQLLDLYKRFLSPLLPPACRFTPTCSVYAREAIERHGLARGAGLAVRRLVRCHPLNKGGFDPIP